MQSKNIAILYSTTIFLSSAMLLVLEILAGRLLAPYVGVSLYTWTSIIGVILAGLSTGNWIGGMLAEKGYHHRATGILLVSSSITSLLILPLLIAVASILQPLQLNLVSASFFYVLFLFFIPAILLGIITPLVTTLYLSIDSRTGTIIGRMHALAAFGSIVGTFITGLVLIQWMGTRSIVIMVAVVLLLLALPFLWMSRKRLKTAGVSLLFFALTILSATVLNGFTNPCDVESNYYCLRVVDEKDFSGQVYARTLVLDHMVHSTNVKQNPDKLLTPYIQLMDALIDERFIDRKELRYFFAGGGAYTHPRAIAYQYRNAHISVSEIDPAVTKLAQESLFLNSQNMQIHHEDSRSVLNQQAGHEYDVIITDVFHDVGIPQHLTTLEFAEIISKRLAANGLYMANVIDVFPGNTLIRSMYKTLKQKFPYVGVWVIPSHNKATRLTYVLSASESPIAAQTLNPNNQPDTQWYQINDFIEQQNDQQETPVLTDNYAPIERLLGRLLTTNIGI